MVFISLLTLTCHPCPSDYHIPVSGHKKLQHSKARALLQLFS